MLLNLKTAMAKQKVSAAKISRTIGVSQRAMSNKVNEYTDFTRSEMYRIHKALRTDAATSIPKLNRNLQAIFSFP